MLNNTRVDQNINIILRFARHTIALLIAAMTLNYVMMESRKFSNTDSAMVSSTARMSPMRLVAHVSLENFDSDHQKTNKKVSCLFN